MSAAARHRRLGASYETRSGVQEEELRLRNLTGHELVLVRPAGDRVVLAPDGDAVMLETTSFTQGQIAGIELVRVRHGAPAGLPEPSAGVLLVTSQIVARHAAQLGRSDVVAPDTSPGSAIREDGKIVAVRRLATFDRV